MIHLVEVVPLNIITFLGVVVVFVALGKILLCILGILRKKW